MNAGGARISPAWGQLDVRARGTGFSRLSGLVLCLVSAAGLAQTDEQLQAHRALWDSSGVVDYEYRYQKICDCHRDTPADTVIRVNQGEIVDVRYQREDYIADVPVPVERYRWFRTVDDLFSLIAGALRAEALVRVGYDPQLGYPTRIYIDYDRELVGEELELRMLELTEAD